MVLFTGVVSLACFRFTFFVCTFRLQLLKQKQNDIVLFSFNIQMPNIPAIFLLLKNATCQGVAEMTQLLKFLLVYAGEPKLCPP